MYAHCELKKVRFTLQSHTLSVKTRYCVMHSSRHLFRISILRNSNSNSWIHFEVEREKMSRNKALNDGYRKQPTRVSFRFGHAESEFVTFRITVRTVVRWSCANQESTKAKYRNIVTTELLTLHFPTNLNGEKHWGDGCGYARGKTPFNSKRFPMWSQIWIAEKHIYLNGWIFTDFSLLVMHMDWLKSGHHLKS